MSKDDQSKTVENNSFYCIKKWDGEKYINKSSTEVTECCLNLCLPIKEKCKEKCSQTEFKNSGLVNSNSGLVNSNSGLVNSTCSQNCNDFVKACYSNCYRIPSKSIQTLEDCAVKCGKYKKFDFKCLDDNKDEIKSCWESKCENECNIDFETAQRKLKEISSVILNQTVGDFPSTTSESKQEDKKWIIFIVLSVLFSGFFITFYFNLFYRDNIKL